MFMLAVGSALGWSFFDFSRRQIGERLQAVPAVVSIMILQTLLCLPFGGFAQLADQSSSWYLYATLSVLANALANTLFVMSVQRAPFTLVVPLLSLTPALAAAFGWIVHDEALTLRQCGAISVVVLAALWLGWQGEGRKPNRDERVGMAMMTVTAFLWAITPFFDRACTIDNSLPLAAYVAFQCVGIATALLIVSMLTPALRQQFRGLMPSLKKVAPWVLLAAIASSVGLYFQILGVISVSQVGLFEAVKRSLTMLVSLLLGRFLLKEQLTRPKIFAAAVMAIGIFLLA